MKVDNVGSYLPYHSPIRIMSMSWSCSLLNNYYKTYQTCHYHPQIETLGFEVICLLGPTLHGKAIKLSFSTLPRLLPLRFHLASVYKEVEFFASYCLIRVWHHNEKYQFKTLPSWKTPVYLHCWGNAGKYAGCENANFGPLTKKKKKSVVTVWKLACFTLKYTSENSLGSDSLCSIVSAWGKLRNSLEGTPCLDFCLGVHLLELLDSYCLVWVWHHTEKYHLTTLPSWKTSVCPHCVVSLLGQFRGICWAWKS